MKDEKIRLFMGLETPMSGISSFSFSVAETKANKDAAKRSPCTLYPNGNGFLLALR